VRSLSSTALRFRVEVGKVNETPGRIQVIRSLGGATKTIPQNPIRSPSANYGMLSFGEKKNPNPFWTRFFGHSGFAQELTKCQVLFSKLRGKIVNI
jgi:hypothetical protein